MRVHLLPAALSLLAAGCSCSRKSDEALQRSGLVEELETVPVVRAIRGFSNAVMQSAMSVRDSVPSAEGLKDKARSFLGCGSSPPR